MTVIADLKTDVGRIYEPQNTSQTVLCPHTTSCHNSEALTSYLALAHGTPFDDSIVHVSFVSQS